MIAGSGRGLGDVAQVTLIQLRAADAVRSRVFAAEDGLSHLAFTVSAFSGGLLVTLASAPLGWLMLHTMAALHYAHRGHEDDDGKESPDELHIEECSAPSGEVVAGELLLRLCAPQAQCARRSMPPLMARQRARSARCAPRAITPRARRR